MKYYLGIDFGVNGALVTLNESAHATHILPTPKRQDGTIDSFEIFSWMHQNFEEFDDDVVAIGEKLGSIYRAAASTTFSFGRNIGIVTGIIESFDMRIHEVTARTWQKYLFEKYEIETILGSKKTPSGQPKNDTKLMALKVAQKLYPEIATKYAKRDGVIDALLIARYGWELNK